MRVTTTTIRSGQPRAYADSERVCRLTFEVAAWNDPNDWRQVLVTEKVARETAEALPIGFTSKKRNEVDWFDSHLDYFRPIDPKRRNHFGAEDETAEPQASVWEFRVVTPFTD